MITLILALLISAPPAVDVRHARLAVFIAEKNHRATGYASELAERILIESARRNIPPEAMAAIAWQESGFRRGKRGGRGEYGIWQLGATGGDHSIPQGWDEIRRGYLGWPIVRRLGSRPWSVLRKAQREAVVDDVRAGTYLLALELWSVRRTCHSMRNVSHRSGGRRWLKSQWHKHRGVDVYVHYHSGTGPPIAWYLRAIRWRARVVKRALEGTP